MRKKNYALNTREEYVNLLKEIISPLRMYYDNTSLNVSESGASYDKLTDGMEGFMRVLWGLVPLWHGSEDNFMQDTYIKGFKLGMDKEREEFWGIGEDCSQKFVEYAPYGLGLLLAPDVFWNVHNEEERQKINDFLLLINQKRVCNNNWLFFRVLVNCGLKKVGGRYSQEMIDRSLDKIEEFYISDGWYSDGIGKRRDYYIAFAMHFYSLIYAANFMDEDSERCHRFIDRAVKFAKDFIYFFDEKGRSVLFGRSLTYRFAVSAFFSALVYANVEALDWGVVRGIIGRNMRWWIGQPIFDNGGVMTLGCGYTNLCMCEEYNAQASQFWALKTFLLLAADSEHPFWKAEEKPLPTLDSVHPIKNALGTIYRNSKDVLFLGSGQWATFNPFGTAEKYAKFAYSAKRGFCIARDYSKVDGSAVDNTLVFRIGGMSFTKRDCIRHEMRGNVTVIEWSPFEGINVTTEITPFENGYISKNIIVSNIECTAVEGGFCLPCPNSYEAESLKETITLYSEDEKSEMRIINGEAQSGFMYAIPNSNILHSRVVVPYFEYQIKKGTTVVEIYAGI